MKEIYFYYDVVCPFAYMASTLIESLAIRNNAKLIWKPVLLGGIYQETQAAQGAGGSATDVMSEAKQKISALDLQRQLFRHNVPVKLPLAPSFKKTLYAMRLLAATPNEVICKKLTHAMYKAYWCDDAEVENISTLQEIVQSVQWSIKVDDVISSEETKTALKNNTSEAVERGAFGVPSFWADEKLFFGVDRMFLLENHLKNENAHPTRLMKQPLSLPPQKKRLAFYFDYASPYSYLGSTQIGNVEKSHAVVVEYVPVLLGAIFKGQGLPSEPPGWRMPEAKRNYLFRDLFDWAAYWKIPIKWNSTFPINTLLPLRVTVASGMNPRVIERLFRAVWQDNIDISKSESLTELLVGLGLDGAYLVKKAEESEIKAKLIANTQRALDAGLCGVPSFQVEDGIVIFGQDRLNVVEDLLDGWTDVTSKL